MGGRGVLPYISYMGMCRALGYGFRAALVWNRVWFLLSGIGYDFDKEHVHLFCSCYFDIDQGHSGLKRGMKNHIFWSEIGSGFWEPCGTPPPKSSGPYFPIQTLIWHAVVCGASGQCDVTRDRRMATVNTTLTGTQNSGVHDQLSPLVEPSVCAIILLARKFLIQYEDSSVLHPVDNSMR